MALPFLIGVFLPCCCGLSFGMGTVGLRSRLFRQAGNEPGEFFAQVRHFSLQRIQFFILCPLRHIPPLLSCVPDTPVSPSPCFAKVRFERLF